MSAEPNAPEPRDDEAGFPQEAPRRAASARFDVGAGGEESLREALDPATSSLGDALKLSYRILQLGIVALVVVFLVSGFRSVKEGDTGVKTLFGAIAGADGDEQLMPGLQPFWPYPIGDLVVFEQSRKSVVMSDDFWPRRRNQGDQREKTLEEQIDTAAADFGLKPGPVGIGDGSLLTVEGDITHAELEFSYEVVDAVRLLRATDPRNAEVIVRAAVRQAAVEAASTLTLAEIIDTTRDLLGPAIAERAQRTLDRLDVGIELATVSARRRMAPLAIQNRYRDVQTARENAKTIVEKASGEARTSLTQVAGGDVHEDLLALIRRYEEQLGANRLEEAEATLVELGARMEASDVGGEVAAIVARSKASEAALRAELARELRRLEGLWPSFREPGSQVVRQLWLDAVREVLENPQAEIYAGPNSLGMISLRLTSSGEIMQSRRNAEINRKRAQQAAGGSGSFFAPNSEQIAIDRAGRQLKRDASGALGKD
jgi:membrane protease subunit HflK